MKKKITSFLLALVMVLGMLPVTAQAATVIASGICGHGDEIIEEDGFGDIHGPEYYENADNIKWVLTSDGTLTFSGEGLMNQGYFFRLFSEEDNAAELSSLVKKVVVGEGIINLAESLCQQFSNLVSVELPSSLKVITDGCFHSCKQLSSITIPANLEYLGIQSFTDCTSLSEIVFTGDAIDAYSPFIGVTATVYYPAGNATWTADIMQEYGYAANLTWVPYGGEPEEPITFSYNSTFADTSLTYDYGSFNENWFFNGSYTYQHDLAQASIRTAMAAFGVGTASSPTNIKKLMDDLGFSYTNNSIKYPDPSTNSIGSAIGHRTIRSSNGENSTLVLVAVRGGGYGEEWGGNFNVGTDTTHEGFAMAADKVLTRVEAYIDDLAADGTNADNIKVWVVGYSRAAATANLVAKVLDDGASGIKPENVYAYCFACPQNTRSSNASAALYRNIFNIVNPTDLVPKVAMSKWDFTRFGTTYYLPAQDAYSTTDYSVLQERMHDEYYDIMYANRDVVAYFGDAYSKGVLELSGQASALDKFADNLATAFISPWLYVNTGSQRDIMAIAESTLGGGGIDAAAGVAFVSQIVDLKSPYGLSMMLLAPKNTAEAIADLAATEFNCHFPELYLAWMDALDGKTLCNSKTGYRTIFVNCPVNVTVYDADGNVVAQIINDVVQEIENGVPARIDDNDQKVIILPNGDEYTVDLEATGSGEMTYTVSEYNWDKDGNERVVSYFEQPIEAGDEFAGIIEDLDSVETAQYPLSKSDVALTPDVSETDATSQWSVTAVADGNGAVTGGGYFCTGEYAKVSATADEGAEFRGWYSNGELVSEDAEYRFLVSKDTELTAKFDAGVTRIYGADRYETAFKTAEVLKQQLGVEKFDSIVVACGDNFADALGGSYLAAKKNAPILLVKSSKIDAVKDYIKANLNPGGTVYLLGGTAAIPAAMDTGLDGFNVKRLAGATRYDTNLLILEEAGVTDEDILICTGKNFADSLSAAAAGRPILLVKDSLNDSQKAFLQSHAANKKYILGGTAAVSTSVENQVKAYGTVERIGGNTRYETSVLIAKEFFPEATQAALAYAQNFPDGLSGGALAYAMKAPLVLTASGKEAAAAAYAKEQGIGSGVILGGSGLISDKTVRTIFQMKSSDIIKIG